MWIRVPWTRSCRCPTSSDGVQCHTIPPFADRLKHLDKDGVKTMGWLVYCNRKLLIQSVSDGFVGNVNDMGKQRVSEWANFIATADESVEFEFKLFDAAGEEYTLKGMWQLTDAGASSALPCCAWEVAACLDRAHLTVHLHVYLLPPLT